MTTTTGGCHRGEGEQEEEKCSEVVDREKTPDFITRTTAGSERETSATMNVRTLPVICMEQIDTIRDDRMKKALNSANVQRCHATKEYNASAWDTADRNCRIVWKETVVASLRPEPWRKLYNN